MAEILLRHRRGNHGGELLHNAISECHSFRKTRGFHEAREGHHHIHPIIGGGEGHLDLRDDAIRAIGVIGFFNLPTTQFQNARCFFHGDNAKPQHIARFAEGPPHAGTGPRRTAGHKAANGRGAFGGRMKAQFAAHLLARLFIQRNQLGAGLRAHNAVLGPKQLIKCRYIQHHATLQRHGLAVIAGAGAAWRHGNAPRMAGGQNAHHISLITRFGHHIRAHAIQLALEHGAIPEEIAAALAHQRGICHPADIGQRGHQASNIMRHAASLSGSSKLFILPGLNRPSGSTRRLKPS